MAASLSPSEALFAKAAELRAGGSTWEFVGFKLHRSPATVRRWASADPARWQAALHDAERRLAAEAGTESVTVLRALMRSEDEKVQRDAARALIDCWLAVAKRDAPTAESAAPPFTAAARELAAFLEGHSDDELERLVAHLSVGPGAEPAAAGGGDGAGAA